MDRDGERHEVRGKVGDNVLYLAHRYGIEMEGVCWEPGPVSPYATPVNDSLIEPLLPSHTGCGHACKTNSVMSTAVLL